jgi:predicted permease
VSEAPPPLDAAPWLARLWIRVLLGTWPAAFRRRLGREMEDAFTDAWRSTRGEGPVRAARLLLRTTWDLLASGVAERFAPTFRSDDPSRGTALMDRLAQDVRFALRSLLRRPGFTAVTILTLALGVGANTAIFSVVNGVLLRPLPWADQDRLITIWAVSEESPDTRGVMSRPDLLDVGETAAFEAVTGYASGIVTLTGLGDAESVSATRVTSGLLEVFGLTPALGRDLGLADTEPGLTDVVVLSDAFWRERLGGDPDVLGKTIELAGVPHRVVGVAPASFAYPAGVQMWRPYENDAEGCGRGCHTLAGIGRLAGGVELAAARAEVDALATRLGGAFPETNHGKLFRLVSLEEVTVGSVRQGIWLLLGAVALVLLIACANVANLMLARAQMRTGEVAVRATLGATRGRLAGQVIVESLVLALLGGGAGLLLAYGGTALLREISTGTIPRIDEVTVDGVVLAFTLGVALLVGLLFGLAPAARVAASSPSGGLAAVGRGSSLTRADARSRGALLTAEVALSLVLLAGAGLLLKSFARLYAVDPGYQTERIVRFTLSLPDAAYPDLPSIAGFYQRLEERIAAEPGVEAVGSAFGPPFGRGNIVANVLRDGEPEPRPEDEKSASVRPVTPGFLETMRIPVLAGRGFAPADDDAGSTPVAVVNERFVREIFPDGEALGKRVEATADFGYGSPVWTIVGVVPDVMNRSLTAEPAAEIYVPHAFFGPTTLTIAVRTAAGVPTVLPQIRTMVREADANLPMRDVETMEQALARQMAPTRFFLSMVGMFALLALVLAATGLYGVATFLASRRRREVGIRIALGAPRQQVIGLLLRQGLRPALYGVLLGLLATWGASRWLETLLFDVERTDPVVYGAVAVLLIGVVLVACLIPAREASRVDPLEALRTE